MPDMQGVLNEVYDADTRALRISGNGTYTPAGSVAGKFDNAIRTAGAITINGTSWANVNTGLDLELTGVTAGQVIEVGISGLWNNNAVECYLDFVSLVAGSPVNTWSQGAAEDNNQQGIQACVGPSGVYMPIGATILRPCVSGDLSAGTLTLRLRGRTGAASNKSLYATANNPLYVWARNHG